MLELPRMILVRQQFAATEPVDIESTLDREFRKFGSTIQPNARIAVGVGSRGIANLSEVVQRVLRQIQKRQAKPFIIPAMGSHGGATPEGQLEVLATYGITEEFMGVPIAASLDVQQIGETDDQAPVYCSTEALAADGIILINRIKPHTDFFGALGSGLLKMCVIGLGKRAGATAMHLAATQFGYERAIRTMAGMLIQKTPVLGGIAILENQFHELAKLVVIPREQMESDESMLLSEAKALMPLLPFDEIDLLIVDRMGKNISGTGMDPNVINRSIHGYNSLPMRGEHSAPFIKRIFVRGLTPETHGNAIGIGLADVTTTRLVREVDLNKTNINSLTALTPQSAKIPIAFDSDREAIERMLISLPLSDTKQSRIVRIADTLSVAEMEISESLWNEVKETGKLTISLPIRDISFNDEDNLSS